MRIVGVLCAYDEHSHWLSTAVSGFAQLCDDIVYVDGSYAIYPQGRARSHPSECEAVTQACEAAGVGLVSYRPRDVFTGNEVEKRNRSLRLAETLDPDWVVIFDADHHVTHCNPDLLRYDLAETELNVATYRLIESDGETKWVTRLRGIYRWTDDLAYGPAHWTISGTYADREWLRGPDHLPGHRASPALDLDSLECVHRTRDRRAERRDAMTAYNTVRDTYEVEKVDPVIFEAEHALA